MTTLLRMLEPANDPSALAHKPIVILVDEFDLFAQHPRQSFLYCLLDIVQGNRRKAGMGVVGLSARSVRGCRLFLLFSPLSRVLTVELALTLHRTASPFSRSAFVRGVSRRCTRWCSTTTLTSTRRWPSDC